MNHPRPHNHRGFTLIEMVAFIIVIGIVSVGIFTTFFEVLRNGLLPEHTLQAQQIAKQRMELILGNRQLLGFNSVVDPCIASPPAICSTPAGFTAVSNITNISRREKQIRVQVSGTGNATLISSVARYD